VLLRARRGDHSGQRRAAGRWARERAPRQRPRTLSSAAPRVPSAALCGRIRVLAARLSVRPTGSRGTQRSGGDGGATATAEIRGTQRSQAGDGGGVPHDRPFAGVRHSVHKGVSPTYGGPVGAVSV